MGMADACGRSAETRRDSNIIFPIVTDRYVFSYPARPQDRLLGVAGGLERVARALPRLGPRMLRRWAAERRRPAPQPSADASSSPTGAPVLYLPAIAWHYRFQRPQQLALGLARAGHPVLYVDGFLRSRLLPDRSLLAVHGGVHVLRLRVPGRPDPYRDILDERTAARLAATILAGLRGGPPRMVLVQLPFWAALGRELSRRLGAPLVYDRIDLHTGFPGVPARLAEAEERLMREADLVAATAGLLAEEPRRLNPRVLLLPNAVDLEAFQLPNESGGTPLGESIRYVGALGPWFDTEAVRAAALRHPEWRIRLAGRIESPEVEALTALANVEAVGEIPFQEVPGFLAGAGVSLVPFRDLPLTRAVDPVKLYESLALGLPVVARRLPETERWAEPAVYLYDSPEGFVAQLERALAEDTPERRLARRSLAREETWDRRAAALLGAV